MVAIGSDGFVALEISTAGRGSKLVTEEEWLFVSMSLRTIRAEEFRIDSGIGPALAHLPQPLAT